MRVRPNVYALVVNLAHINRYISRYIFVSGTDILLKLQIPWSPCTESKILICVFCCCCCCFVFVNLSYQNACYGCENAWTWSEFLMTGESFGGSVCKHDWGNVRSYLFFNVRTFLTAMTFRNISPSFFYIYFSNTFSCPRPRISTINMRIHYNNKNYHV